MKLYKKNIAILMAGLLALSSGALVTSCDEDDDYDTNQFASGSVSLTAASLQVTRGAYMTFKGVNLNRVTSIQFPGGASSTPEVVDEYTIRCLVPEEAEPGTVKLIYDGGELETKEIAFTEPITFDAFTPESVTAGDELTIKGTYLSYISFVQFATGENVAVEPAGRNEFKLTVPVDASTGKVRIGYCSVDGGETVETLIESDDELTVIETSDAKLTNETVKAGEDVIITGKLLRLVKSVTFNGVDPIDVAAEDPTKDVEKIVVSLPATAQDGAVTLTLFSGNTVSAGNITTVVPTAAIKEAKASYGVGESVVIEGENLDLIVSAQFDGEEAPTALSAEEGATYTRNESGDIALVVPAAAKSGDITLALANGTSIKVSGFVTTKPVFTFPASATPLDVLKVESTLAARISTLKFGDIEAAVTATEDAFTVTVPLAAESGKVTYVMDNGEEGVASENFTVNSYTFCAFADADSFTSGTYTVNSLAAAVVVNGDNLENVLLNGKDTKFLLTGETLYVYVGSVTGSQTVTLVTGETKVDYTIEVTASGVIENVIWTGPLEITWNDGGRVIVKWSDLEKVPAGSTMRLYFNGKDGVWAQAQLNNGAWDNAKLGVLKPSDIAEYNWWDGGAAEEHAYDITLTQDVLDHLKANVGSCGDVSDAAFIIQGSDLIFSKVSVIIDYSAPKSIWSGSFSNAGWVGNQDLAWGGFDWSTVKAGQTLYFTVEKVNKGAWGCLSLRSATCWAALADAVNADGQNQFDVGDEIDATTLTFTLTQAAVDDLNANNGLVMIGDNLLITNIAIK